MTARDRFQKSNTFRDACAMISSPLFEEAIETALLTFIQLLPDSHVEKYDHAQQLVGAKRFIRVLNGLITVGDEPKVPRRDTLQPTK